MHIIHYINSLEAFKKQFNLPFLIRCRNAPLRKNSRKRTKPLNVQQTTEKYAHKVYPQI